MELVMIQPQMIDLSQESELEVLDVNKITIPTTIKNKVLISPGIHNGLNFTSEEIILGFQRTDWSNKKNYELIKDHSESVDAFVGYVRNINVTIDGTLMGDLELWDEKIIKDLVILKAKFGVSVRASYNEGDNKVVDMQFKNFSIVSSPADENAYINLSKEASLVTQTEPNFIDGYEFAKLKDVKLSEGVTSSTSVEGTKVDENVNEKRHQPVKKKKKKKEDDDSEEELSENNTQQPSSEGEKIKLGEKKLMEEEVVKTEETVEESKKEEKQESELSSKLDLILSKMEGLSTRIAKLEEEKPEEAAEEAPAEEPAKEEATEEEAPAEKAEESEEEESEVEELKAKVAELSAKLDTPKSKTQVNLIQGISSNRSAADKQLAEVLLANARQ